MLVVSAPLPLGIACLKFGRTITYPKKEVTHRPPNLYIKKKEYRVYLSKKDGIGSSLRTARTSWRSLLLELDQILNRCHFLIRRLSM